MRGDHDGKSLRDRRASHSFGAREHDGAERGEHEGPGRASTRVDDREPERAEAGEGERPPGEGTQHSHGAWRPTRPAAQNPRVGGETRAQHDERRDGRDTRLRTDRIVTHPIRGEERGERPARGEQRRGGDRERDDARRARQRRGATHAAPRRERHGQRQQADDGRQGYERDARGLAADRAEVESEGCCGEPEGHARPGSEAPQATEGVRGATAGNRAGAQDGCGGGEPRRWRVDDRDERGRGERDEPDRLQAHEHDALDEQHRRASTLENRAGLQQREGCGTRAERPPQGGERAADRRAREQGNEGERRAAGEHPDPHARAHAEGEGEGSADERDEREHRLGVGTGGHDRQQNGGREACEDEGESRHGFGRHAQCAPHEERRAAPEQQARDDEHAAAGHRIGEVGVQQGEDHGGEPDECGAGDREHRLHRRARARWLLP